MHPLSADVLVIGLGPAGLAAAGALARGGVKVLAVDRNPRPGAKACAGGLTARCCALLDTSHDDRQGSLSTRLHQIEVRAVGRSALLKGQDAAIVTVDRVRLAQQKLEELRDLGVEVRLGETARPMGYEAVIACDGASSRTRRGLGLPSASGIAALQRRYTQAQAMAAGLPSDRAIVWFEPKVWGCGYAWSFPAPGEVRLGCGVPMSHRSGLRRRFEEFVASLGFSADGSKLEAGLVGTRYCGHRFGKIRLAGDAAGLASPLTGEGIYQALVSGAEVAREILEPGYLSPVIPALSTLHRRTVRALDQGGAASVLYPMAPALLSLAPIARLAASRYVR